MSVDKKLLRDISEFRRSSQAEREQLLRTVARELTTFRAGKLDSSECGLPLVHKASGLGFTLVPGGQFEMGLRDDDIQDATNYVDWTSWVARQMDESRNSATPVRVVRVSPFLCARTFLTKKELAKVAPDRDGPDSFERDEARELAGRLGLRLLSEAEFEWVARDGAEQHFMLDVAAQFAAGLRSERLLTSSFGIRSLLDEQWVEDDWHPNYSGAPANSIPWFNGDPIGVLRGGLLFDGSDDPTPLLTALAGARHRGVPNQSFVGLRLACDLPADLL